MTPQSLALEVTQLFALPDVVIRVCRVMDSPRGSAQELVEALELDAGMTASVLKLANSAFYGHGRVDNISHAVTIIGHKALRNLVLAVSAVRTFRNIPREFVDMDTFWENSIACGMLAKEIALRILPAESETLFVAGLLHGVGRLVFYARRPNDYRVVLQKVTHGEAELTEAEREVFGFTHAELGAALMQAWALPENLWAAVGGQLNPNLATDFKTEAEILYLASNLGASLAPCLKSRQPPDEVSPDFAADILSHLALTRKDLDEISLTTLENLLEVIEIIHPNPTVY